jgi:hypothetical protein
MGASSVKQRTDATFRRASYAELAPMACRVIDKAFEHLPHIRDCLRQIKAHFRNAVQVTSIVREERNVWLSCWHGHLLTIHLLGALGNVSVFLS